MKSTPVRAERTAQWTGLDDGNVTMPAYQDGPYPRREAETLPRAAQGSGAGQPRHGRAGAAGRGRAPRAWRDVGGGAPRPGGSLRGYGEQPSRALAPLFAHRVSAANRQRPPHRPVNTDAPRANPCTRSPNLVIAPLQSKK